MEAFPNTDTVITEDKVTRYGYVSSFRLDDSFIDKYVHKEPPFAGLGYVVYKRTYARPINTLYFRHQILAEKYGLSVSEEWWLTVARVVEGVYKTQEKHCKYLGLPWSYSKAQRSAQEMYDLIFNMKFLPPGRGLWAMGTPVIDLKKGACLQNCGFVSTKNIDKDFSEPFCFLMDMSMFGVGCGFDTLGKGKVTVQEPSYTNDVYVVEDSREGWVELLRKVLDSFVGKDSIPETIDYSNVRPKGSPIKTFGGVAPGPEPLEDLICSLCVLLRSRIGESIKESDIVDIMNLIGKCVVAGNTRRSAEIALGSPYSDEYLNLKNPEVNKDALMSHRWASNNSVLSDIGMDYSTIGKITSRNGEPGYVWLSNCREFGRMKDGKVYKDLKVDGVNPCGEQPLENMELCNLVETFPAKHDSYEEFERTLKFAYLYSKTVTLIPTHNSRTNSVMLRNRRIGTSMSGIVQAMTKLGKRRFFDWCDSGYMYLRKLDDQYSNWLCIPKSIKMSTVKPSGSVSLLNGSTPGVHFPHSKYYYRVVRLASNSPILKSLEQAGYYTVEIPNEPNTTAVYFPVKEDHFDRAKENVTLWEQLELAAQMQYWWCDNSVSITVTFKPEEADDIPRALELYETRLKSVSFLPLDSSCYEHAPYQSISEEEYNRAIEKIKDVNLSNVLNEKIEKFCDGDTCEV